MKRKKIIRYILVSLFVIVAAAALYIYKEYNRRHKDTASLKPDYSTEAASFIKEFENNEKAANKKFLDKVIRVEGVVKEVVKDEKGFYTLALGDTASMSSVRCNIDSMHTKEAVAVMKGNKVAIKGICSGFNADELLGSDVILVRSVLDQKK
ncbi:MAG: hypothetical protein HZB42_02135 [Sphingobacteriales bacterium]|nr:hypothetical protein [Sphingobacteriales bacterium]